MQTVHHAADAADAQRVRDALEREGIRVFVSRDAPQVGAGPLPPGGPARVDVADEDAARARAIVQAWQAAEAPRGDNDAPAHDHDGDPDDAANARAPGRNGFGRGELVFALIAGAALGALVAATALHPHEARQDEVRQDVDYDRDGVADERVVYRGQRLLRMESDRNSDGRVDAVTYFDANGLPTSGEEDQDFDGVRETRARYDQRLPILYSADYDGDGVPEWRQNFRRGGVQNLEWLDRQGRVVKRDEYVGGRLRHGQIDRDGDGKLDTARVYDDRGEVLSSEPLPAR